MSYWWPAPGITVDQERCLITYDVETGIEAPSSRFRDAAKYTYRFCGRASPEISAEDVVCRSARVTDVIWRPVLILASGHFVWPTSTRTNRPRRALGTSAAGRSHYRDEPEPVT